MEGGGVDVRDTHTHTHTFEAERHAQSQSHRGGVGALPATKIDSALKLQWKKVTWIFRLRAGVEGEMVWIKAFLGLFPNRT